MKKIISLLLCTTLLCACFEDVGTDNKGSIAGTVLDYTVGDPSPVVNVVLKESNISTVTGTDGTFWFNNIPEGEYTIEISKNGYKPGEKKVSVNAGVTSEYQLLLERIPAIVTADRDTLDFGKSYNTMSFNIVNSSYEDMEWSVEENCKWITEVKPKSGVLKFGGSETIVIVIDRDMLDGGTNSANIVLRSTNGSTEVKVIAEGEYKTVPSLETYEVTNIRAYSATLNGEVTNSGSPEYTERGFVYSTTENPTIENCITKVTSPKNSNTKFSCDIKNLELGQTYYVRAYATNSNGTAYSQYDMTFTTQPVLPTVSTFEIEDMNYTEGSATLRGKIESVGEPAYTERGFVWSTTPEPTINDNCIPKSGTGTGTFSCYTTELPKNRTFFVRAYAKNQAGVAYGNEVSVSTEFMVIEGTNIMVQTKDLGKGDWYTANSMCENSTVGGYRDWRLPTLAELAILYNNKDKIGGFTTSYYWSSSKTITSNCYYIYFYNGSQDYDYSGNSKYVRAVRTIE